MNPKEENEVDIVANHTELKNVFDASKITKISNGETIAPRRLYDPKIDTKKMVVEVGKLPVFEKPKIPRIVWSSLHPK
jgi:hypothetical protein